MSVASEILRLQNAKAALKTSIEKKGVTVSSSTKVDGYSSLVDKISPRTINVERKDVNFYDYDGTLLHSYTATEFQALTELPANPVHDGLTSQGWNWTLADAKEQVTLMGECDISQCYVTSDGKTRLYCHFEDVTKNFLFGVGVNGTVVIDWGDGSDTNTLTGTSTGVLKSVRHNYTNAGDYLITLTVSSGTVSIYGTTGDYNTCYLLREAANSTDYIHYPYAACLKKVELGNNVILNAHALKGCRGLETITIPSTQDSFSDSCFRYCTNLRHITMPIGTTVPNRFCNGCHGLRSISMSKGSTIIPVSSFNSCHSLKNLVLPSTVASTGGSAIGSAYSLTKIIFPEGFTIFSANSISSCYGLSKIIIPSTVTTINANTFKECYGIREYHLLPTTPPTITTTTFANISADCKIYVPSAKLTDYQTAENWSAYSSQMYGE